MTDIDWEAFTDIELGFDDDEETICECEECGVQFDIVEEGHDEDGEPFCERCYNNIFGGEL